MRSLLARFAKLRVLIIGDVMLDEYLWGDARRISPEAPIPIVEIHRKSRTPGGAANTAINVVSLGGAALLGGVVGQDHHAAALHLALERGGVVADGLFVDDARPTTVKTRVIAQNQQIVRVDDEVRNSLCERVEDALLAWAEKRIEAVDCCVISDYAKGVVTPRLAEELIRMSNRAGKPIVVDPKGSDYTKYRGATVVTPNVSEVEQALRCQIGDDLLEKGERLRSTLGGSALLITRSAQGMTLLRDGALPAHIPSKAHSVYDVTGAGDTVVSALALALAAGASLERGARLANCAAGVAVGKVGTSAVTAEEVLAHKSKRSERMAHRQPARIATSQLNSD